MDGYQNRWPKWWPFVTKKRIRTGWDYWLCPLEEIPNTCIVDEDIELRETIAATLRDLRVGLAHEMPDAFENVEERDRMWADRILKLRGIRWRKGLGGRGGKND